MKALDGLNAHYGRDTLADASAGRQKAWKLRRDFMSSRYTTCWEELLFVDHSRHNDDALMQFT